MRSSSSLATLVLLFGLLYTNGPCVAKGRRDHDRTSVPWMLTDGDQVWFDGRPAAASPAVEPHARLSSPAQDPTTPVTRRVGKSGGSRRRTTTNEFGSGGSSGSSSGRGSGSGAGGSRATSRRRPTWWASGGARRWFARYPPSGRLLLPAATTTTTAAAEAERSTDVVHGNADRSSSVSSGSSDSEGLAALYRNVVENSNGVPVLIIPPLETAASDFLDPLVAQTGDRQFQFWPVHHRFTETLNKLDGELVGSGRKKRQDDMDLKLPEKSTVCETRYDWVLLNRTWDTKGEEVEIYHGRYAQYVHVYYCANKGGSCTGINEEFSSECLEKPAFAKLLVKKEPTDTDELDHRLAFVQIPHHCFCQLTKRVD